MKRFAAIALLAVASSAWSSTWVQVTSSKASKVYVDMETVKRNGNQVTFWAKTVWEAPRQFNHSPTQYDLTVARSTIDCGADTEKPHAVAFSLHDRVVQSFVDLPAFDIQPDSVAQGIEIALCRR